MLDIDKKIFDKTKELTSKNHEINELNNKIKQITTNNDLLLAKLNSESYKFDNTSHQFKSDI